mmetsp:Transcript_88335/g.254856  ORF Transcript_88335/g.254856 Transcript_88335/m.254856 type:complete len:360 (+) Transcript_88335:693-1772(+)
MEVPVEPVPVAAHLARGRLLRRLRRHARHLERRDGGGKLCDRQQGDRFVVAVHRKSRGLLQRLGAHLVPARHVPRRVAGGSRRQEEQTARGAMAVSEDQGRGRAIYVRVGERRGEADHPPRRRHGLGPRCPSARLVRCRGGGGEPGACSHARLRHQPDFDVYLPQSLPAHLQPHHVAERRLHHPLDHHDRRANLDRVRSLVHLAQGEAFGDRQAHLAHREAYLRIRCNMVLLEVRAEKSPGVESFRRCYRPGLCGHIRRSTWADTDDAREQVPQIGDSGDRRRHAGRDCLFDRVSCRPHIHVCALLEQLDISQRVCLIGRRPARSGPRVSPLHLLDGRLDCHSLGASDLAQGGDAAGGA